jgi:hypothetical protein
LFFASALDACDDATQFCYLDGLGLAGEIDQAVATAFFGIAVLLLRFG